MWGQPLSAVRRPKGDWFVWPHSYQESRASRAPKSVISALNFLCTGPIGRSRGQTAEGGCLHTLKLFRRDSLFRLLHLSNANDLG
jgi:hypothetical protein